MAQNWHPRAAVTLPLLDDPGFLEELEKIDISPPTRRESFLIGPHPTMDQWLEEERPAEPTEMEEAIESVRGWASGWLVAAVAVLGTLAGAGLATVVFHERVLRMLSIG